MKLMTAWHFFVFVWLHSHWLGDLGGWLRVEYPGMPGPWYMHQAHWLVDTYGTGRDLLIAVRPW